MPYDPIRSRQAPGSSRAPDPVDTTDTAHRHGQDHEHGNRNRPRRAFGISWPGWFRECQPGAQGEQDPGDHQVEDLRCGQQFDTDDRAADDTQSSQSPAPGHGSRRRRVAATPSPAPSPGRSPGHRDRRPTPVDQIGLITSSRLSSCGCRLPRHVVDGCISHKDPDYPGSRSSSEELSGEGARARAAVIGLRCNVGGDGAALGDLRYNHEVAEGADHDARDGQRGAAAFAYV
jgi:hypothetical protein